jgi:hypothetical protein
VAHFDFILASEQTSQTLAQTADLHICFGHEMETLIYTAKVQKFFLGRSPEPASQPIQWVVYGPFERKINPNFQATDQTVLVSDRQELQIYQAK